MSAAQRKEDRQPGKTWPYPEKPQTGDPKEEVACQEDQRFRQEICDLPRAVGAGGIDDVVEGIQANRQSAPLDCSIPILIPK